jgi:hypothetical protein
MDACLVCGEAGRFMSLGTGIAFPRGRAIVRRPAVRQVADLPLLVADGRSPQQSLVSDSKQVDQPCRIRERNQQHESIS